VSATFLSIVGARPNFMKLAPLARALAARPAVRHIVVHTGQHYDAELSDDFFRDLAMPPPECNLGVGSGSHGQQTGAIMQRLEPLCIELRPDIVVVYGDVNSTVAAALVAAKLGVRVAHVEAGLRSRDWSMPEEINRVVTDRVSDLLFTPSRDAVANLRAEGVAAERIHFVGNVMIDSLVAALPAARAAGAPARYGVGAGRPYTLVTLHRPSNVDDPATLAELVETLTALGADAPVLFPVHPRTRARLEAAGLGNGNGGTATSGLHWLHPMPYLDMLSLVLSAGVVMTDSGGLQEETTYLGVPCVTVRPGTERPITCLEGTNRLVPPRRQAIELAVHEARRARPSTPPVIERWDGAAGARIAEVLCDGARFE
jgi:UDP-N-acetylglucosamine 2-epimerase (non-hydrolysing)